MNFPSTQAPSFFIGEGRAIYRLKKTKRKAQGIKSFGPKRDDGIHGLY